MLNPIVCPCGMSQSHWFEATYEELETGKSYIRKFPADHMRAALIRANQDLPNKFCIFLFIRDTHEPAPASGPVAIDETERLCNLKRAYLGSSCG